MEINSHYIKVAGKAEIPEPLVLGEGYKVTLDGEVISTAEHNNQDGTKDLSYSFKPATCTIENKYGAILKAKDPRKWSEQLRRGIWKAWQADESDLDEDKAYERTMRFFLTNIYEFYEEAKKNKS